MGSFMMPWRTLARSSAEVLCSWALFLFLENVLVATLFRRYVLAGFEMAMALGCVLPLGLAALSLLSPVMVLVGGWAKRGEPRWGMPALAFVAAGLSAYGVSFGRHFAALPVRAAFVVVVAVAGAVFIAAVLPRLLRLSKERLAIFAAAAAMGCWFADAFVLRGLYPGFHLSLFALAVVCAAIAAPLASRLPGARWLGAGIALVGALTSVPAAARVARADNLRFLLLERAPWMGRAVAVAALIRAPEPVGTEGEGGPVLRRTEARVLDWTGQDIILITIDALRADHVSAYGYSRKTTPNIDALAAQGSRFEHAYCPTPHTSYSVTSLMTGKYMRSALAMGAGLDSDTWAGLLRTYGYRTAGFYPPAVFFIDPERFETFRDRGLDFEYRKVEFATPALRQAQIAAYLSRVPRERPLFLWVHFFEPHEPYEAHAAHVFGDPARPREVDAYDGEVAMADHGVGLVVDTVRKARPNAAFIVTADHGEEFGDHGGRYHGSSVYEEQVRVPLVVVGPGVKAQVRADVVQTVDLLPTVLSALGVPRPPRIIGRDIGPVLADRIPSQPGLAFSESDDLAMLAQGTDRLVCRRRAQACALFDLRSDPRQERDTSAQRGPRALELRRAMARLEAEQGTYEANAVALPEALRRGMQGEREAAVEVASLLDDARVELRRKAAETLFALRSPATVPQLRRTFERDEDQEVRRWCALSLARLGQGIDATVLSLLGDADADLRLRAALALGEQGDFRGVPELAARFAVWRKDFELSKQIIDVLVASKRPEATTCLIAALPDVRLRPFVVKGLGDLGSKTAREPLLRMFEGERYQSMREPEARALLALGAKDELRAPLLRFAGVPEPWPPGVVIAKAAGLLTPGAGGAELTLETPKSLVTLSTQGAHRAWVSVAAGAVPRLTVQGQVVPLSDTGLAGVFAGDFVAAATDRKVSVELSVPQGHVWLVPHADEIPPPPPEPFVPDPENPSQDPVDGGALGPPTKRALGAPP